MFSFLAYGREILAMPLIFSLSYYVLWGIVILETLLLLLMLRALGGLKDQIRLQPTSEKPNLDIEGLPIGKIAPSFSAVDQFGVAVTLDKWQGQRRLLVFVSSGCSTCKKTIGYLNKLHVREPDIQIIVVGMDHSQEENREFAESSAAQMPILTAEVDVGREIYKIRMIVAAFAIDEMGRIRAKKLISEMEHLYELIEEAFGVVQSV
jgi:peroxiredoxin